MKNLAYIYIPTYLINKLQPKIEPAHFFKSVKKCMVFVGMRLRMSGPIYLNFLYVLYANLRSELEICETKTEQNRTPDMKSWALASNFKSNM